MRPASAEHPVNRLGSMPGNRALLSALAAAACAVGVAACGGDDEDGPIPAEQGNQLLDQLDEIEAAVSEGIATRPSGPPRSSPRT